jgi:2Fe-2S ferredoxin
MISKLIYRTTMLAKQRASLPAMRKFSVGLGHPPAENENPVKFKFAYTRDGGTHEVLAREGETLLEVAHNNHIELEGACAQSLACSTCHIVLEERIYDELEPAVEEEEDLLDLAYGLTLTSRLGCQIKVSRAMEGMIVKLPSATRNFYVDKTKVPSIERGK